MRALQIYALKEELQALFGRTATKFDCSLAELDGVLFICRKDNRVADCRIGAIDDHSICESVMSFDANFFDESRMRFVRKEIKATFHVGLWFVNEDVGVKEFYRQFHCSPGVLALQGGGRTLRQFSSSTVFAVADPEASRLFSKERKRIIRSI